MHGKRISAVHFLVKTDCMGLIKFNKLKDDSESLIGHEKTNYTKYNFHHTTRFKVRSRFLWVNLSDKWAVLLVI
jgi:hypothetical protein